MHIFTWPHTLHRAQLSRALVITARKWATHLADQERGRLTPIIESLSNRYVERVGGKPAVDVVLVHVLLVWCCCCCWLTCVSGTCY